MSCFFFFSSRRRHTRLQGDWSSDVCSSDLSDVRARMYAPGVGVPEDPATGSACVALGGYLAARDPRFDGTRSEERRVGKSVDLGGRRIIKKKKEESRVENDTMRRHRPIDPR